MARNTFKGNANISQRKEFLNFWVYLFHTKCLKRAHGEYFHECYKTRPLWIIPAIFFPHNQEIASRLKFRLIPKGNTCTHYRIQRGPRPPRFFSIMQFSGNFDANFGLRPHTWGQNSDAPSLGSELPLLPFCFSKSCSFQAILTQMLGSGPPWGQNSAAPPLGSKHYWGPWPKSWIHPWKYMCTYGLFFRAQFCPKNIIDEWHKRTGNLFSHQRDSDILWVSNNWDSSEFSWDRNKSFLRFKKTLSFKTEFGIFLRQFWVSLRQFEFSWESFEFLKIEFWVFLREFRVSWVRVWSFLRHSLGFSWIPEMEF